MNIAVCIKQIPDPAAPYQLDPDTHFLVRPEDQILDDTDRYGIEVGLQLAEASDGHVTLVTMGPSGNLQAVRQALAMGPDQAIVVDDPNLRGADALTTARILGAAISRGDFAVVVAGTESTDGYSGILPQQLAEILSVPALTYARRVELIDDAVRVERQSAGGYDVVEATVPLLLTVTAGAVEPRYPTFKGIMDAKSKPVEQLTAADLGVTVASHQSVVEVRAAPERSAGKIVEDDGEGHLAIVELLEQAKVI